MFLKARNNSLHQKESTHSCAFGAKWTQSIVIRGGPQFLIFFFLRGRRSKANRQTTKPSAIPVFIKQFNINATLGMRVGAIDYWDESPENHTHASNRPPCKLRAIRCWRKAEGYRPSHAKQIHNAFFNASPRDDTRVVRHRVLVCPKRLL